MHGSMRRREATPDQSATPRGPRKPPADPTTQQAANGRFRGTLRAAPFHRSIKGEAEPSPRSIELDSHERDLS